MHRSRRTERGDKYATTHAQVHHQHSPAVEIAQQVLAAASRRRDSRTGESVDDRLTSETAHRALARHIDAIDARTDDATFESAPDGFNFGKFRHVRCAS
jgi:hypothetical protein